MRLTRTWKISVGAVIFFLAVVGVVNLSKDYVVKSAIAVGISQVTGTKTVIGRCRFDVFKGQIAIHDLYVYNPAGFPDQVLIDFPEIDVRYDLPAFFQKKLHLPLVIMDLKEVVVVRNKEGKLNVDGLNFLHTQGEKMEFTQMHFDMVTLSVGRVIYYDLGQSSVTPPQVFYLNMQDKTFHNINGAEQFATAVLFEAFKSTALKNLAIQTAAERFGYASGVAALAQGLMAPDESRWTFAGGYDKIYMNSFKAVQSMGTVKQENKLTGLIKANIDGTDVTVKIGKLSNSRVGIAVSARKLWFPRPGLASRVLYTIEERMR